MEISNNKQMQILANARVIHPDKRRKFSTYELTFDPPKIHRFIDSNGDKSKELRDGMGKYVIAYKNNNHREVELFALLTSEEPVDFMEWEKHAHLPPEKQLSVEDQLRILRIMGNVQSNFEHDQLLDKYKEEIGPDACGFEFIGGGLISVFTQRKLIQLSRGSTSTGAVPWTIIGDSFEHDKHFREYKIQIVLGEEDRDIGFPVNHREEEWYRELRIPVILAPKKQLELTTDITNGQTNKKKEFLKV